MRCPALPQHRGPAEASWPPERPRSKLPKLPSWAPMHRSWTPWSRSFGTSRCCTCCFARHSARSLAESSRRHRHTQRAARMRAHRPRAEDEHPCALQLHQSCQHEQVRPLLGAHERKSAAAVVGPPRFVIYLLLKRESNQSAVPGFGCATLVAAGRACGPCSSFFASTSRCAGSRTETITESSFAM